MHHDDNANFQKCHEYKVSRCYEDQGVDTGDGAQRHVVTELYAPIAHRILSSIECDSVTAPIS